MLNSCFLCNFSLNSFTSILVNKIPLNSKAAFRIYLGGGGYGNFYEGGITFSKGTVGGGQDKFLVIEKHQ